MRRHARTVLAALILVGALAGCSSTTTAPAPSSASSKTTTTKSTTSETSASKTSETSESPIAPGPPDSLTMTCKDWRKLDDAAQLSVVNTIITAPDYKGPVSDPDAARLVAKGACLLFSDKTVADILATGS